MSYHTEGSKFRATENIGGSELVKLIKQDLREQLPNEYKVLARKEVYAGGWSIHFTIKNTGIDKYIYTGLNSEMSPEYKKLHDQVYDIIKSYNFDDGDIMTDYAHVRFYSHIKIEK